MTRRQVAFLFRVTSQAVVRLARRGRLTEVRNSTASRGTAALRSRSCTGAASAGGNHRAPVRGRRGAGGADGDPAAGRCRGHGQGRRFGSGEELGQFLAHLRAARRADLA